MKKTAIISAISLVSLSAISANNLKFDRSLEMSTDRISAVEFDVGAGSLNIVGTTGNEIRINATIESEDYRKLDDLVDAFENKMLFSIERQSEYAMVYAKKKESMGWGNSKNIMIHLEVELPRGMDLVIDDGSGSMTVENIAGELKIDDGSGSITLRDIANDVQIDDGSGSIQVAGVNGDLSIEDGSGSIELKNISGSVDIEDGSGGIMAKDIGGDFTVDDGSGDVVVKNLTGQFTLIDDGSGSVTVNGARWGKK
ncbi:DUF4097 family beta strand repeat-containing protein [Marinicella litoralis]|uniref:Uncharacterized protein n=1 Tax=Marinicella litoralis TaxID=644220 RepID=A0A4R6XSI6_9GAMM|nr:DUF4097 family beta strand repeat-containing protein [Marinicella litoralis]TDR20353.1 hypothetical protein C8D91_1325 [Marinicella litoralis]